MTWAKFPLFLDLTVLTEYIRAILQRVVLEKAEEPEIKLPTSAGSSKKQESSRKHLFLL